MRDTSSDPFWGALIGKYFSNDEETGCLGYSLVIFFLIVIVGSVFSIIEDGIIDVFGGLWEKLVVLNILILLLITFALFF